MLFLLFFKVLKFDYKIIDNVIINKIKNFIVLIWSVFYKVRYYFSFMRWILFLINFIRIFVKFNYRYKFVYYFLLNNDFGVFFVFLILLLDIFNFFFNLWLIFFLICGFFFKYILIFFLFWFICLLL